MRETRTSLTGRQPAAATRPVSRRIASTVSPVVVPGRKISRMPSAFERRDVLLRNDPAGDDEDVFPAPLLQELQDLREEDVVRAREDRQADDVDVLLDGGRGDLLAASAGGPSR